MDPPGCNSEPAQLDDTLLDFDPDSFLDAWVADLFAAEDQSIQQDGHPASMPAGDIFSDMDNCFGSNESAFDFGGPLGHFQISDMPQDCVSGLDPSMADLPGVDPFSVLDPSVLQHSDSTGFQFNTGGGQNPPSDVTMEDLPSSSCTNLGDLHEEAANISNSIVFPLQTSMLIGGSNFMPQAHDIRAAHHIDHFGGQLTNAPGAPQHAPPTSFTPQGIMPQVLGPDILTRRQIPPKRRGGRRGKLSREQARQRRETKLSGVCIRCRRGRIRCSGGIPCGPCIKTLGKSRIWTTPCTKAQFLDIIEAGSSLPFVVVNEIALFRNPDIQSMMMLMGPLKTMLQQEAGQYVVLQSTRQGKTCQVSWAIVGRMLLLIFGDLHEGPCNWTMPSFSKVASTLADCVRKNSSRDLVMFETEDLHTPQWAGSVIAFCQVITYQQPPQPTINSVLPQFPADDAGRLTSSLLSWTGWVASRYLELYLFHYLQDISNNTSVDSVEDRKSYIMCIFSILLLSTAYPRSDSLDERARRTIPEYCDAFDRRGRVLSALWVYCSIAVRGLPAWTNIWETIHQKWPFIQVETMAQQFNKNATAFNNCLSDAWESFLHSVNRFDEYYDLLFTMRPDSEEEVYRKTEVELEFKKWRDAAFVRYLHANRLDDWMQEHDQRLTGGVLSAQTTSQKRGASTHAFAALALIDWRRKPVLPWDPMKPVSGRRDLLQSFVQQVRRRLSNMSLYSTSSQWCPTGTTLEEFVWSFMVNDDSTPAPQISRGFLENVIRSGRRWNELQDMVGSEVVLMHDPLGDFLCNSQPFHIPSIVDNGSERQFTRLKEIIPTRLQWLAEACVELRGIIDMLATASGTEQEHATAIQDQIQTIITTVFGSRSSVEEAFLSSWAERNHFSRGLTDLFRSGAATIPFDIKLGLSLCLLEELSTKLKGTPATCIDFEMKENVCREAESMMERDFSTLDSESRSELRVWSYKVLDFFRCHLSVDTASQASG